MGMQTWNWNGARYITQRRGALRRCFRLREQSGRVCKGTVEAGTAAEERLLWHPLPSHSRLPGLDPEIWEQEEGRRGRERERERRRKGGRGREGGGEEERRSEVRWKEGR